MEAPYVPTKDNLQNPFSQNPSAITITNR